MPRKENGFGKTNSFEFKAFKDLGRVDKGKGKGAAGLYPSNRRYGSSVNRSVIEKWDLDSDWVKWRKGFEYYNRSAWYQLVSDNPNFDISKPDQPDPELPNFNPEYIPTVLNSILYQGEPSEVDVTFTGYKFATKNADSNNHYVVKRTCTSEPDIGIITSVQNDAETYKDNRKNRQIRCKGTIGADAALLFSMVGERLTDGETEATLDFILDSEEKPVLYIGKSWRDLTEIEVTIPLESIVLSDNIDSDIFAKLEGEVVYIPNFYVQKALTDVDVINFEDGTEYFGIEVEDVNKGVELTVVDALSDELPPSLYDISSLPKLFTSDNADYTIKGTYVFQKEIYQYYFGRQYVTSDLIESRVESISYSVLPFTILGSTVIDNKLVLKSVPATTEVKLYSPLDTNGTLVFTDYSFTKSKIENITDKDNFPYPDRPNYNPIYDDPLLDYDLSKSPFLLIDTDIDPWQDEVFTSGKPLQPATLYTCSCPNHSQSILSAPQQTENEGQRKINRQRRYPLPTVLGQGDFSALGKNQAAGKIESWESREHRMSFKMCKHSIAAMYIDRIKILEPNKYPTVEARAQFEEKLTKEMNEVGDRFEASYRRGGITTLEIIFALAQGLNLDDVELAYVILNSNF